jgi:hypothetical protein
VEVYTPIPEEALHRAPRTVRGVGVAVLVAVLVLAVAAALRFTFAEPSWRISGDWHDFGTIQTRFGTAEVARGGDTALRCDGDGTALLFAECTPELWAYFTRDGNQYDARVRELIGKRPPTGTGWTMSCPSSGSPWPIHGAPAKLAAI